MNKYNIGDVVWFIHNNKVASGRIQVIRNVDDSLSKPHICYCILYEMSELLVFSRADDIYEANLFKTKKELINSL